MLFNQNTFLSISLLAAVLIIFLNVLQKDTKVSV